MLATNACYYCGKTAHLVCDHGGFGDGRCGRRICHDCAVPEYEGGDKEAWTLCKEHARFQVPASVPE